MTNPIPCNCWLMDIERRHDEPPCPSPCVFDDPSERVDDCSDAMMLLDAGKSKTDCKHYREASSAAELTDEQLRKLAATALDYASITAPGEHLSGAYEATASELLAYGRAAIAADRRIRPSTTPKPPQVLTDADIPPQLLSAHDLQQQWNQQADEFNQWDSLDLWEQIAWAQARAVAADRAARGDCPPGMVITADPSVAAQREEVLTAFVAKHGCQPDAVAQIGNILPDGRTTWHLERRPQPTAEALQDAYVEWFRANQAIAPSAMAARTAALFTLAVLLGEVKL